MTQVVGRRFAFEDLQPGLRFRTRLRTIGGSGVSTPSPKACCCRPCRIPGLRSSTARSMKAPTVVGDTIHAECEVIEHRLTSKGDRGLVRFANQVVNQRGEALLAYNRLRLLNKT